MWKVFPVILQRKHYSAFTLGAGLFSNIITPNVHDHIEDENNKEETEGWRRLKKMFSYNRFGSFSPQLSLVKEGGLFSFLIGGGIGAVLEGTDAYEKFIQNNKITTYVSNYEARRKLQDSVLLSMMKGGWRVGWRFSLITTSILLFITTFNTYRGYSSVFEFAASGFVACGIYKIKHGMKPALAGGLIGGGMGTLMGVFIVTLMRITDFTFDNLYDYDAIRIEEKDLERKRKIEMMRTSDLQNQNILYRPYKQMEDNEKTS